MNCGKCFQPLAPNAQFCGNCGTPVLQTAAVPVMPQQVAPAVPQPAIPGTPVDTTQFSQPAPASVPQPVIPQPTAVPQPVMVNPAASPMGPAGVAPTAISAAHIKNYRVASILVLLLLCLPLGLIALIYSSKVDTLLKIGDVAGAEKASRTTRTLLIIGAVIGILAIFALIASGGES